MRLLLFYRCRGIYLVNTQYVVHVENTLLVKLTV